MEKLRSVQVCRKTISAFHRIVMSHRTGLMEGKLEKFPGQEGSTLAAGGVQSWEMQDPVRVPVWLLMSQAWSFAGSHVGLFGF